MKVPVHRWSPHLRSQVAPMVEALRKNGVEPKWLFLSPAGGGARRRERQKKARAHKLYEDTCRREAAQQ